MLIYLYFVTSNFPDGLNWLFSCLPEGVKPLGENLLFPRLRPCIVINFKMGSLKLLSIKVYCWNSKLENQQAKKNCEWLNEVSSLPPGGVPCFISPCERRIFLEASFQGGALGWCITWSWRINTEPSLRNTAPRLPPTGPGRCHPLLWHGSKGACGARELSQAGLGHPKQSARHGQSTLTEPLEGSQLPSSQGGTAGTGDPGPALFSLSHTWSAGFSGSKGNVPDPEL